MTKYGHHISTIPMINMESLPDAYKKLRMALIHEEYNEMMAAMNVHDLEQIADAAADLVYVVVGACITYGIPFDRVFKEVHRSNMTKQTSIVKPGEKYASGIDPKGPGFIRPDVRGILENPSKQTLLETVHADLDFEENDAYDSLIQKGKR